MFIDFVKEEEEEVEAWLEEWWLGGSGPSHQRFSSGSVSSGGDVSILTASTNARKTVRAGKEEEILIEEKEEDESLLRGCYSYV